MKKLLVNVLITKLLENIKLFYNVNGELVKGLRDNSGKIIEIFLKIAPFFKIYSTYAANYVKVLDLIKVSNKY